MHHNNGRLLLNSQDHDSLRLLINPDVSSSSQHWAIQMYNIFIYQGLGGFKRGVHVEDWLDNDAVMPFDQKEYDRAKHLQQWQRHMPRAQSAVVKCQPQSERTISRGR